MITSEKQLIEIVDKLKAKTPSNNLLLFRGKIQLYDKIQSSKRRLSTFVVPEVEDSWNTIVSRISENHHNSTNYNQAILQHYGLSTNYLDLTKNPVIAAWFACHQYKQLESRIFGGVSFRFQDESTYEKIDEGIGYLYIYEIPNYLELISQNELFDITNENIFLRPKCQDAFLIIDQPPRLPNPNNFIIETLEINRSLFEPSKKLKELFPSPKTDIGYAQLLNVPFIQTPSFYFNKNYIGKYKDADFEIEDIDKSLVFAKRVISIPKYIDGKNDRDYNPKWEDITLYEPSPFRIWKIDDFNISEIYEGQSGEFGKTVKITISPKAFDIIKVDKEIDDLEWPSVDSNSIFFTLAEYDYDKIIDHSPPYHGVWLHKDGELLIESNILADNDHIELHEGHAYTLNGKKLELVRTKNQCKCGNPDNHIRMVQILLKIHRMISLHKVALIQHPLSIPNWYILL